MERIELGDVLLIAEIHIGIDAKRLARMDRVVALVQSALAAPFAGFGDVELFPTFEAKQRSTVRGLCRTTRSQTATSAPLTTR